MKYGIIILIMLLCSCELLRPKYYDYLVDVENQLPINIYCVPSYNYPDTSLNFTSKGEIIANKGSYFIPAKYKQEMFRRQFFCDKAWWKRNVLSDTLQVFVLDEKVLNEKSWGQIYSNDLYLRRVLVTYDEICNNDCSIIIK
jgi:hypothetical protein